MCLHRYNTKWSRGGAFFTSSFIINLNLAHVVLGIPLESKSKNLIGYYSTLLLVS